SRVDELVICEKRHYLRGRTVADMNAIFRAGAAVGGYRHRVPAYRTELASLKALLARGRRGDVVAVMSHVEREEIFAWLDKAGYRPLSPLRLRALLARRRNAT
ncbi:MAG: Mur ligase, partial [bacterium]